MQLFRNEKGSTLLLVMITVAMLTVLGTTILSMSFMNTNMKFSDERMKKTLYYSESGIEQVYSVLGYYIDEALKYANTETEAALVTTKDEMELMLDQFAVDTATIYADESEQDDLYTYYETYFTTLEIAGVAISRADFMSTGLYIKALLHRESSYDNYASTFLKLETTDASGNIVEVDVEDVSDPYRLRLDDCNLLIDTEQIMDTSKRWMKDNFKLYFDTSPSGTPVQTTIINEINGLTVDYVDLDDETLAAGSEITIQVNPGVHGDIEDFNEGSSTELVINVTSTFKYRDLTRKAITTDLVIQEPPDVVPLKLQQTKISVENNPLWQYALITEEDIIFDGKTTGNVTDINGSIYALGTNPTGGYNLTAADPSSPRNPNNYDGIKLAGTSPKVTVDGDVVSQSYVQVGSSSTNAHLTISNSHVYCNSMVIQSGSTNGKIDVIDGNVYTSDDLELNGTNCDVNIDGSYYGFVGTARNYNQTSSIVINSDLSTSSLTISGDYADINYPEDSAKAGIYIAGVSYINDTFSPDPYDQDDHSLYQTGESMGIKGNYIAYAYSSSDTTSPFHADNLSLTQANADTANFNLNYAYRDGTYIGPEARVDYFKEIADDPTYNSFLKTGSGNINIDWSDYRYTQGIVFGDDSGTIKYDSQRFSDPDGANFVEDVIAKDYVFIMNTLVHRSADITNHKFIPTGESLVDTLERAKTANVIANYSKINSSTYFPFDAASEIRLNVAGGPSLTPATEVVIVVNYDDGSSLDNILLVGDNTTISKADGDTYTYDGESYYVVNADPDNNTIQGIIMTSGKVAMIGDLNFKGAIIADERITVDKGNIDIDNKSIEVRKYLAELTLVNAELKDVLDVSTASTVELTLDNYEYIDNVTVETSNIDALRQNYNEFIYYRDWSISE